MRRLSLTVSLIAMLSVGLSAQGGSKPVVSLGSSAAPTKAGQAIISGTARDANAKPLANVTVRLRNVATNEVEQVVTTNQSGEFSLVAQPDTPYVVEVVDRNGRTLAVSSLLMVEAGDVAATILTVPAILPRSGIAGIFGESIAAVLAAAAWTGITVADEPPPLSPEK